MSLPMFVGSAPARWRARLAAWLLRDEQVFVREALEFRGKFRGRA